MLVSNDHDRVNDKGARILKEGILEHEKLGKVFLGWSPSRMMGVIEALLDTREAVIAEIGGQLEMAKKEQDRWSEGDVAYYWEGVVIAGLETVLAFICNPKEAIDDT